MNDIFIEYLIKRKPSLAGIALRGLMCVVLALLTLLAVGVFIVAGFYAMYVVFFIVLFGYIAYKVWQFTDVEYEYSILNGEVTIDRIAGQSRRKTMEVFSVTNAEIVAPADSEKLLQFKNRNIPTKDYSSWNKKNKKYVAIAPGRKGVVKIIFEPNQAIIDAMHSVKPGGVYLV